MRFSRSAPIPGVVAALTAALCVSPSELASQNNRPTVAIFAPIPADRGADSAYVQDLTVALRDRLIRKRWRRFNTLRMCNSTDACEQLIEGQRVRTYARLVFADYFVSGSQTRESEVQRFRFDIGETNRGGGFVHHTATVETTVRAQVDIEDQANELADFLFDNLRVVRAAGREARGCWNDLLDRDYRDAREHANRAMERVPRHPYAATCLSLVFTESGEAIDSVIWALTEVTSADSTIHQAWADLANAFLRGGDTARAVGAMAREVRADREDRKRLARIARDMNDYGYPDSATAILDEFLSLHPTDQEIGEIRIRLCAHVTNFKCALHTMSQRYEADSGLVGDTSFYFRAIAMARAADASPLGWTTEALERMSEARDSAWSRVERARIDAERLEAANREILVSHAAALAADGMSDSALAIYETVLREDSLDLRAALGMARILITPSRLVIDSGVLPDTVLMARVRSVLERVVSATEETRYHETAGLLYLDVAGRMIQARADPQVAMEWAERARELAGEDEVLVKRGRALKGVAAFYRMVQVDGVLREAPTCELLSEERELILGGRADLTYGASEFPEAAGRILSAFAAYEELVPAHHEALQCEWTLEEDVAAVSEGRGVAVSGQSLDVGSHVSDPDG